MIIAFTTSGNDLSAPMEERFGRAPKFLIYDTDSKKSIVIDNQYQEAAQGAGIKSAETVAKAGARIVITGECGPKALTVLKNAGIKVFSSKGGTVQNALGFFLDGRLNETKDA